VKRIALAVALALTAAGCGSDGPSAPPVAEPPPPPPPSPPPISITPPPISVPPPVSPPPDMCGAWELQGLVGKPRREIPVPVEVSRRRVVCTTCPRTMDYSPARLTIEYDAATDKVTSVACG
jgi:hypothetical protein